MKLAILLMIYKDLQQVKMMINALSHPDITIFVHADKKMNLNRADLDIPSVVLLPEDKRVNVKWGTISEADAVLNMIDYSMKFGCYDYYWLCTGQDFPLLKSNEIVLFFKNQKCNFIDLWESRFYKEGKDNHLDKRYKIWFPEWMISNKLYLRILKRMYVEITGGYNHTWKIFERKNYPVEKFFFGEAYWCLNRETMLWIYKYIKEHPEYHKFLVHSNCQSESFIQTLVMMSPYADNIEKCLHYIDWSQGGNHPKILTCDDYESMMKSGKLMARKFDIKVDAKVFELIQNGGNQE